MRIEELNASDRDGFVSAVGDVFEDSPWVAEQAWLLRPFRSLDDLCDRMTSVVTGLPEKEQLALLRAHPDLGTRARIGDSSTREQAGAGLDRLTPEEYDKLLRLNRQYKSKFGFPFLYAVKGSDKHQILEALELRLESTEAVEFEHALRQVFRIARFRLQEKIG